jgi:heme exporter protein CcmD
VTHLGYIVAAYVSSFVVIIALALWTALDLRQQKRRLMRLEAEGLRRRSGPQH